VSFRLNAGIRLALLASLLLLSGCRTGEKRMPAIGEAFVGPSTLQLHTDPAPQSAVVATAKHGERVEIVEQKRRMARVRISSGAEGWTEERLLLAGSDMAALRELAARAAKLPTQGQATTYGDLHVHTQPSYDAPSFLTLKANDKFEVLQYAILPRHETPRVPLVPPLPPKKKVESKKLPRNPKLIPPPPLPKPPGPPPNWLELSKSNEPPAPEPSDSHAEKPVPTDRWSLIRMPGGESGWVYTRLITMAIPDEVAQYAEGHRIVSYFPIGNVQDGSQSKPTWLWTTASSAVDPSYDFDSFRVFIWSLRHHRYETAHIELHLKGYLPVLLDSVEASAGGKGKGDTAKARYPGFSVCILRKDGQRTRREYAFANERIRFVGEQPCEAAPPPVTIQASAPLPDGSKSTAAQPKESVWARMKRRWHSMFK
jgi:SH3-like domain-containing protein